METRRIKVDSNKEEGQMLKKYLPLQKKIMLSDYKSPIKDVKLTKIKNTKKTKINSK